MKQHPQMGADILVRLGKFETEAQIVLSHHERMDGSGYPSGLVAGAIPLGARILSVADTYDVLVSDRPTARPAPERRQCKSSARSRDTISTRPPSMPCSTS